MTGPLRTTAEVEIDPPSVAADLLGVSNETMRLVARTVDVDLGVRGNVVPVVGAAADVALVERFLAEAAELLADGLEIVPADMVRGLGAMRDDPGVRLRDLFEDVVLVTARRRPIRAKTIAQRHYTQAVRTHDLTFGIGPAGTGKTYLAMAMAVRALLEKQVQRIVLARPAVEAGEKLGFLPGDLAEKVNPYFRPLDDALHEMIAFRHFTEVDVVRHPLVARIVVAYARRDQALARDRERSMAPRATRSQGAAAPPAGEFTAEKGEDRE